MNEIFNYCHVVSKTDIGRKRTANEDNMYNTITQNGLVSVVCDGMGGHVGGSTASKIAISTIIKSLHDVYYEDPRIAIGESIDKANKAIIQKAIEQPELAGMGSTCVLLLVREGKVYIGHVGDSRIYLIRSKRIIQLTKDHSYVQMLVDCGEITKEQAEHHPRKNEITNALGIPNMSPATVADDAIIPEAGDCFVLCSDGLSGMVSDDTICKIISRQSEMNAQERVDKLVAMANDNGGVDNITVQLVEFPVSPNAMTEKNKLPIWAKTTGIIFAMLILCIGGYLLFKKPPTPKLEDNNQIATKEEVKSCDTITWRYPEKIPFKKNATIVELEFGESFLALKRDGCQIYIFESSFDQHSLYIATPDVDVKYNNSLLSFTKSSPGNAVIFYITQSDKSKTYKCIFDISTPRSISIPSEPIRHSKPKGEEVKPLVVETAKVDSIFVRFEYEQLEKGAKLLLNYSAKPMLIFNKKEKSITSPMLGEISTNISYNDLFWRKDSKKGQLSFEFKGGASAINQQIIEIPCFVKDSKDQIVLIIELSRIQKEDENLETPKEEERQERGQEVEQQEEKDIEGERGQGQIIAV